MDWLNGGSGLRGLAVALFAGLLMGIERGWTERAATPGSRVAGIRTFSLLGLVGGAAGLLTLRWGAAVAATTLLSASAILVCGYWLDAQREASVSATTTVAGLFTVTIGLLATTGQPILAAIAAVAAVFILSTREVLHDWLARLSALELRAGVRFLILAVIVLPLLPDKSIGPYGALNPFRLGVIVVLLCGLSFAGYWLMKWLGGRRGLLATAAAGALASSTAVTLALSRMARANPDAPRAPFVAAILLASLVMLMRILLLTSLLARPVVPMLILPVLGAAVMLGGFTLRYHRQATGAMAMAAAEKPDGLPRPNPFELMPALLMTAMLAAILIASSWARAQVGDAGVFAVTAITGIMDVDAVIVSMGRLLASGLTIQGAAYAILIAAGVNTVTKALLPLIAGYPALAARVGLGLIVALLAGAAALAVQTLL